MYINNIFYDNLLFVHIPKTAGQSIFSALNEKNLSNWYYTEHAKHDPLFLLERNNNLENVYRFTVVRNPFRRTFSYYKHFDSVNNSNYTFREFIDIVKNDTSFPKTKMIHYPQSFYCLDYLGNISLDKIYKFENLSELENDLDIKLPHNNKGNYSEDEYFNSYTTEIKDFVRDFYSSDFYNFNYCLDFI